MSDPIQEGRTAAEAHFGEKGAGFKNANRLNAYECDGSGGRLDIPWTPGCGSYIVTIDREPGVTPFIVKCRNCGRDAHSKMYRVSPRLDPTHEWARPDSTEGLDAGTIEHLRKGGLILRPIAPGANVWRRP